MLRLTALATLLFLGNAADAQRTAVFGWTGNIGGTHLVLEQSNSPYQSDADYDWEMSGGLTARFSLTDHLFLRTGVELGSVSATQAIRERIGTTDFRTIYLSANRLYLEAPVFVQLNPFRTNGLYLKTGARFQHTFDDNLMAEVDAGFGEDRRPFTPREAEIPSGVVLGEFGIGLAKFDGDRARSTWIEINFGGSLGNWIERAPAASPGLLNNNYAETARLRYLRLSMGAGF